MSEERPEYILGELPSFKVEGHPNPFLSVPSRSSVGRRFINDELCAYLPAICSVEETMMEQKVTFSLNLDEEASTKSMVEMLRHIADRLENRSAKLSNHSFKFSTHSIGVEVLAVYPPK